MSGYGVDLSYVLPNKAKMRIPIVPHQKGPYKPQFISYMKDHAGRLCATMDRPQALNIGGRRINNVMDYVVSNFVDAATDKGKLYAITTPSSDISAYTFDGKFAFLREKYVNPRTIKIGNNVLKDVLYKTETADGAKEYQAITKCYRIKTMRVSPDGVVTPPEKNIFEKTAVLLSKKAKSISKLLKFF